MNKRGIAIDDFMPLLITLFIFVVVILIVLVTAKARSASTENQIQAISTNAETVRAVNNFLHQEVFYEGQKTKMIDLMATVGANEDQKIEFLQQQTEEQFKNYYSWIFDVKVAGEKVFWTASAIGSGGTIRCTSQLNEEFEYIVETPNTQIIFWCQ